MRSMRATTTIIATIRLISSVEFDSLIVVRVADVVAVVATEFDLVAVVVLRETYL